MAAHIEALCTECAATLKFGTIRNPRRLALMFVFAHRPNVVLRLHRIDAPLQAFMDSPFGVFELEVDTMRLQVQHPSCRPPETLGLMCVHR